MASGSVHSKRTDPARQAHDLVVVGDSPIARNVRELLKARRVSERAKSPVRFSNATGVVIAAHQCDFADVMARKQSERRADQESRAENVVVDAMIAKVPHIVVISSAMVVGPAPGRAVISDDDPRGPALDGYVGDVVAFEEAFVAAIEALAPQFRPKYTILRPAAVVGPSIDTLVTRHFEAPRLLSIRGEGKPWQFAHVLDIASAIRVVLEKSVTGVAVLGAVRSDDASGDATDYATDELVPDELCLEELLKASGMRGIELSKEAAFATADRLHKFGVLPAPARDLETAVYPWSVFPKKLLAAGWRPLVSSHECVTELMAEVQGKFGVAGRRVGHKDAAALGAAGAAVALLSTAAIWRQARGKH